MSSNKRTRSATDSDEDVEDVAPKRPALELAAPSYTCPHEDNQIATETIDEYGDLLVIVGEFKCLNSPFDYVPTDEEQDEHYHTNAVTFKVDSKTLARSSKVWKAMLFGPFVEAKPTNGSQWLVKFPQDNPDAFRTILHIVYNQYKDVPVGDEIGIHDLYEVTVLSDKYDLTYLLRPWALGWTDCYNLSDGCKKYFPESTVLCLAKLLWVSWELGHTPLFNATAREIALYSNKNKGDGTLMDEDSRGVFEGLMLPHGVDDVIATIREESVEAFLSPLKELLLNPVQETTDGEEHWIECVSAGTVDTRWDCQAASLGMAIMSAWNHKLWSPPDPKVYTGSPMHLRAVLQSWNISGFRRHCGCRPSDVLNRMVDTKLKDIRSMDIPEQQHLATQSQITGLMGALVLQHDERENNSSSLDLRLKRR